MNNVIQRAYEGDQDFLLVRDFLIHTYALYRRPFNWLLDRWNFCRYHVVPLHTAYSVQYFGVPTGGADPHRDELPLWERTIRIWEDGRGEIVGVVHSENEEPGEVWIQIHPDFTYLYGEMVTYAEEFLINWVEDLGYVRLYVNERSGLERIAAARGYQKLEHCRIPQLVYHLDTDAITPALPRGFKIRSVMEEDNVDQRRKAKALAFGGHYSPSSWPPASAFREMQQAPDYRKDLDLFIVAPDGEYAAFCTIWLDVENKYGNFEPVGTHVAYQGRGLGRALLMEGFRRMSAYGMERSYMDSAVGFYRRVGFEPLPYNTYPWIKYFRRVR